MDLVCKEIRHRIMIKTIEKMEGLIYLEDGTVFKGHGFGFRGTAGSITNRRKCTLSELS